MVLLFTMVTNRDTRQTSKSIIKKIQQHKIMMSTSKQEDVFVEYMRKNNEHLKSIINDNEHQQTQHQHFDLNCLNDIPSIDFFVNKNIGLNYDSSFNKSNKDALMMNIDTHNAREELCNLFNIYNQEGTSVESSSSSSSGHHHVIVKGVIGEGSTSKTAYVNIEQVFLIGECDTRLFKIEHLQMLGPSNVKAMLHAESRALSFGPNDNIYGMYSFNFLHV
jgi:glycerol kinase